MGADVNGDKRGIVGLRSKAKSSENGGSEGIQRRAEEEGEDVPRKDEGECERLNRKKEARGGL